MAQIALTASDKEIFAAMIQNTKRCLKNTRPKTHADLMRCETAYFSELDDYTYHTHPRGLDYPSDLDRKTTKKFRKKYLAIGLVPSNEVVIWGDYPTYDKMIARFKV